MKWRKSSWKQVQEKEKGCFDSVTIPAECIWPVRQHPRPLSPRTQGPRFNPCIYRYCIRASGSKFALIGIGVNQAGIDSHTVSGPRNTAYRLRVPNHKASLDLVILPGCITAVYASFYLWQPLKLNYWNVQRRSLFTNDMYELCSAQVRGKELIFWNSLTKNWYRKSIAFCFSFEVLPTTSGELVDLYPSSN